MAKKKATKRSPKKAKSPSKSTKKSSQLEQKRKKLASTSLKAGKSVMAAIRDEGMKLVKKLAGTSKTKKAKRKK